MNNPYFYLLKISWQYGCNIRPKYVLVYILYILNNLVVALHPLLYAWFIDSFQREGFKALENTWKYILGFFALRLLEWAFHGPARVLERQLAFRISRNFIEQVYHKVLHLPMKWHKDHHSGETITRVRKAYESLKEFFQSGFVFLHTFCKFFFSFAAMLYFAPLFGFIALGIGIFTIWVIFKFDKPFVKTLKEVNEKENIVASSLFDTLSNITTVITLRLEKRVIMNTITKLKRVYPSFKKNIRLNEIKWFTGQMLVGLIFAVTVLGYVYQNFEPGQVFYIGGLVALLTYVNNFTSVFNDVAFQYTRIVELKTNFDLSKEIIENYKKNHLPECNDQLPENWNLLQISKLNFSHEVVTAAGNIKLGAVKDVNLTFKKGNKIALIGESGSGKSSILSLLRGLYVPEKGVELLVNNEVKLDFSCVSNAVTLFPQDPEIFENTIRYNITMGLPFTDEEVNRACDIAQFSDVAKNLPKGIETNIQEKGVNLSGGQKQRLALARGILAALSNSILLLDEPTSSVDPKTELRFYKQFFENFPDKIIISSLHRLHLLPHFDYIYILDKGSIVAEGSFVDLHTKNKIFQNLWKHQEEHQIMELSK